MQVDELRRIWNEEFLPSIRQEIKMEMQSLKASIVLLTERCNTLEKSQQFLSNKYDTVVQTLQNVKEQATKLDKKYKEAIGSLEAKQRWRKWLTRVFISNQMFARRNTTVLEKGLLRDHWCPEN